MADETRTVPSVVGLTREAAEAAITGAGLTVGAETETASDTVLKGSAISQTPAADTTVAAGSAVNFEVSTGPAQVTVPSVVGLTREAAEAAITGARLTVGTKTESASDTVPKNGVISQTPDANTSVNPGSAVKLEISSGPVPQVAVPSVVGLTRQEAETALTNAGLTVGRVTRISLPLEGVIGGVPVPGTSLKRGTAVNLEVSGATNLFERFGITLAGLPWTNLFFFLLGVGLIIGIIWGFSGKTELLTSLGEPKTARALLTFLISITTVGIAVMLAISTIVLKGGEEDEKRFDRGKQVLSTLIGILGTIIGFYFGSLQESQGSNNATTVVTIAAMQCEPTSVATGMSSSCSVTLSAQAPAGGSVVLLASSDAAVFTVPGSVSVEASNTSASFMATAASGLTPPKQAVVTATLGMSLKTVSLMVTK